MNPFISVHNLLSSFKVPSTEGLQHPNLNQTQGVNKIKL